MVTEGTNKCGAGRGCILLPSLQMLLEKSGWGVAEGDSNLVKGREGREQRHVKEAGDSVELWFPFLVYRFGGGAREDAVSLVAECLCGLAVGAPTVRIVLSWAPLPIIEVRGDVIRPSLCADAQEFELVGVGKVRQVGCWSE